MIKKKHGKPRPRKKRSDIDHVAMAIVNHVCETHGISVEERQKHNDDLMDYAYGKIMVVDMTARKSERSRL